MIHTDILVSGGGIAGMAAAAAFGRAGFSVICVDPAPPVTEREAAGADMRSTAFLQPAQGFLARAGLWERLAGDAALLRVMRILDAGREGARGPVQRDFDAGELGGLPFGWNLPNWLLRREFAAALKNSASVTHETGVGTRTLLTREGEATVGLSDGRFVRARLVIAADGRGSPMRAAAGIKARTIRYGQRALAFTVTHPTPHENVSTEVHLSGGPFTLVPLPDRDGRPASAVVWMERGPEAERLAALETTAFEAEATARSCEILGPLTLASRRSVWPIISQVAEEITGERLALVAEAAHVVPPIGAQGLNMSLADLDTLLTLAEARPEGLGDAAMLAAYSRARLPDIRRRIAGIDMLNRASMATPEPLRAARAFVLDRVFEISPLRRRLMRLGLGASGRD
ncbi:2-octaprenyl-6-methoxyphenol hydroxylase [Poseidonocella sedimentorum]|uniref:2-octaprenyl-6-methoxyphenol hydroxylase n=2 Tax=Poseidonocella sedimentorum TaxID=871652 RepID=A0A1I6DDF9_9RHOB|nr:UbiH/UbiF family hydroxylase [Poseidonocella sedimentorum]SFR03479.1 2-octaprenyl-6-methoxyphenol hydroxylase [Poseidonocella sedimentorum]